MVSLPYEFTLFSNPRVNAITARKFHYLMNLHYSQTVSYNIIRRAGFHYLMNLHYSQTYLGLQGGEKSFTTLWIYTILKLSALPYTHRIGFTTLWIYTILKLPGRRAFNIARFTTLWIYTILKLLRTSARSMGVSLPYEFTLFSN